MESASYPRVESPVPSFLYLASSWETVWAFTKITNVVFTLMAGCARPGIFSFSLSIRLDTAQGTVALSSESPQIRNDRNMQISYQNPWVVSLVTGVVLFTRQSWVKILWPPAIRDVTGYILKGADLFAWGTPIRRRIGSKHITTVWTFPLGHRSHLPASKILQYVCFLWCIA